MATRGTCWPWAEGRWVSVYRILPDSCPGQDGSRNVPWGIRTLLSSEVLKDYFVINLL